MVACSRKEIQSAFDPVCPVTGDMYRCLAAPISRIQIIGDVRPQVVRFIIYCHKISRIYKFRASFAHGTCPFMHIYELDFRTFPIIEMNMIFVRFDKNVADRFQRRRRCRNVQSVSINAFNEIMDGLTRYTVPYKLTCFTITC